MLKTLACGLLTCALSTAAFADVVDNRRAAMDQIRVGAATLVPMMKGAADFDAKTAELALRMTYAAAIAFDGSLFPEGSSSKGASPAIWDTTEDFDAKRAEFLTNAAAAVSALPTDLEGLKAVYQPLLGNCAACHTSYRIKN